MNRTMTDDERINATLTWASPGSRVVFTDENGIKHVSVVQRIAYKYAPGAVVLETPIRGYYWWNVDELSPYED